MQKLPFQPIRGDLYSWKDLIGTLKANDPKSVEKTVDFATYRFFVTNGRDAPDAPFVSMMEALHDNSITQARGALIQGARNVAGIMGGHRLAGPTPCTATWQRWPGPSPARRSS